MKRLILVVSLAACGHAKPLTPTLPQPTQVEFPADEEKSWVCLTDENGDVISCREFTPELEY